MDRTRRARLARLERKPGLSATAFGQPLPLKLPAVVKPPEVLSDANPIARTRRGRTVSVDRVGRPMEGALAWIRRYERFWSASLDRLADSVEEAD